MSLGVFADEADNIFEGKQDYLILGTVKDVTDGTAAVTVDNTVGASLPSMIGKDIYIEKFSYSYCTDHAPDDFNNPKIGDNVFASISKNGETYIVANGAYRVDSIEIKNLSTVVYTGMQGEDCLDSSVKIAYFIRSNGKITEFKKDDEGKIYAINNKDKVLVYPLAGNQCIKFVDESGKFIEDISENDVMPIGPAPVQEDNIDDKRWIKASVVFAGGAVLGFIVLFAFYAKKRI